MLYCFMLGTDFECKLILILEHAETTRFKLLPCFNAACHLVLLSMYCVLCSANPFMLLQAYSLIDKIISQTNIP